ncbi:MAG: replication initiator protein A [Oligoflexia bacterium]|nr:replication initiator protein A [Oligoflexia bacterium]
MSSAEAPVTSSNAFEQPSRAVIGISRDEMNLAEFPLTVLSTRANPKLKTLEFQDSVKGKNGELITRKWIITGADKFGLPTASDDEVLLGLLKLTVDDGFRDRKVFFTRYELLRILRWTTEGRSYVRLQKALDRLSGVRVKATNAFYDNETKCHSTRNFGIIDAYEINDGRSTAPKPSFFTWSDALFRSFQVGFIKKLDFDYYLTLQSSVSKRLYRYLDKHYWYKSKVQINLFTLAHEKVGISRNYAFASSLRQQLDPAIEELVKLGFLAGADYVGKGKDTDVILYSAVRSSRQATSQTAAKTCATEPETIVDVGSSCDARAAVHAALVQRGIKVAQVERLLKDATNEHLQRVKEVIAYYDLLRNSAQGKRMTSPVGFLYRAVEKPFEFVIPPKDSRASDEAPRQSSFGFRPVPRSTPQASGIEDAKSRYLVERRRQLAQFKEEVEPELLKGMTKEVTLALSRLKGLISDERLVEAVQHGVEEKLLKLFGFPEFEAWLSTQSRRSAKTANN